MSTMDSGIKTLYFTSRASAAKLLLLVLVLGGASPHAVGSPMVDWAVGLSAGYDDQVYADHERQGIVEPVEERFGIASSRLQLRWDDLGVRDDRFDLLAEGSYAIYGDKVTGDDFGVGATARYHRPLAKGTFAQVSFAALQYRRGDLPLFDLDQLEIGARIARTWRQRWFLTASVSHRWPRFSGRLLDEVSGETENDRQLDLSCSALRTTHGSGFAGLELGLRWNRSNDALVVYKGPLLTGRLGTGHPRSLGLVIYGSFGQRIYGDYPVLKLEGEDLVDTGDKRKDATWILGLVVERLLLHSVKVFADISHLEQTSNIDALAIDQTRASVGLQISRGSPGPESRESTAKLWFPSSKRSSVEEPSLAPAVTGSTVRFRHKTTGAESVSLVGGFNAWDPEQTPLTGPDAEGVWEVTITVEVGVWRYSFVVDGQWVRPSDAPRYEADGFGSENGILHVRGRER
ncbi:hypothetical protein ACFL6M_01875 [Candidatus Eisenbacteria bacterium]|uniref:AMP-activated protein kinase glycogen-binding domain-containing protein n=1 Tax=Eiseniibacteriota bacterium TaxID=2212470 RepID=A0ABV6YJ32_UNCEI